MQIIQKVVLASHVLATIFELKHFTLILLNKEQTEVIRAVDNNGNPFTQIISKNHEE